MKLTIIFVGKPKEHFWQTAQMEYLKRLKSYLRIELQNIKESNPEQEALFISKRLPTDSYIICLDEKGSLYTSKELANKLRNWQLKKNVMIVIGGSYGLADKLLKQAHEIISLSPLTFNHEMARILFLEQLYRAYTILHNQPYHH